MRDKGFSLIISLLCIQSIRTCEHKDSVLSGSVFSLGFNPLL